MINFFTAEGFKSIEHAEVQLGRVNVFIGANGSGKSNLLEALALLAASAFGRVDEESIVRRGGRYEGIFQPQFAGLDQESASLKAANHHITYNVSLEAPPPRKKGSWKFKSEHWRDGEKTILDRSEKTLTDFGDPQIGRAAFRLATMPPDDLAAEFLRDLADFCIYNPDPAVLRGWVKDPHNRDPIGLAGGNLSEALGQIANDHFFAERLEKELKNAIGWFRELHVWPKVDPDHTEPQISFDDKYFERDRFGRAGQVLSISDVNEGTLYLLFIAVLCHHPAAPPIFAIDNADQGLNPLLARQVMGTICNWILDDFGPRQILLTIHNPLALDGLPLHDDRVRLFTVDRDNAGRTQVRRFQVADDHRKLAENGWTLSRMWVNKLIGGVPNV